MTAATSLSSSAGNSPAPTDRVDCCMAGCGPAGAMLGLLLARAGLSVVLLEKHGDFLRDFRGDTIHPSTLEILDELGLADRFLELPHTEISQLQMDVAAGEKVSLDLGRLPGRFHFIALVPQWDFLKFITEEAARYPGFHLRMNAEVTGLLDEDGVVRGIDYRDQAGEHQVRCQLTVGADGRESVTRDAAGLPLVETSPPMDVLWFRISRRDDELAPGGLRLTPGHIIASFDRRNYWQIAYLIPKGGIEKVHSAGIDAFRRSVADLLPPLAGRVDEITDWDQVKLLTVRSDRLRTWSRPGYLAIGDAAHAMSPIAGVGINLAIQDAVAAAHVLWSPLRRGHVTADDLARVQRRRELPTRFIQWMQTQIQNSVLAPTLESTRPVHLSWQLRAMLALPVVRDLPARFVAYGVARSHVGSPSLPAAA